MKRLIFLGMAVVSMGLCAREEQGYGEKVKRETNRIVAELKSVGRDLYSLLSSKKDAQNGTKKESLAFAHEVSKNEPVIESCNHCKDLCAKDQSAEYFA